MDADSLAVTKRSNGQEVILRSADLADMCHEHQWMFTDHVDFVFDFMRQKYPSLFTITSSNFVSKFYNAATQDSEWRNCRKDYKGSVFDDVYNIDITNAVHILHPLLVNNHWVLLYIDKNKKICTIYDSYKPTQKLRKEIFANALPVFLKDQNTKGWNCRFFTNLPKQTDGR